MRRPAKPAAPSVETGVKLLKQLQEDVKAIAISAADVFIAGREGPVTALDFSSGQPL